jgi:polyisoprenoid-binding protein YceI
MPHFPALRVRLALSCLSLLPAAAFAAPATYALDPVHTRVVFAVSHAGFSEAVGTVSGSTGVVHYDPDDLASTRVEVEVPLQRLDLGDEAWNRATLGRRLLATDEHPVARFTSTRVDPVAPDRARVTGLLELRGVTREVALDVVVNAHKRHPMPPFRRTLGVSATGVLSRAEFGIDAWESMIGDTVTLRIEAEATRSRSPAGASDDADDADDTDDTDEAGTGTPDAGADDGPAAPPPGDDAEPAR